MDVKFVGAPAYTLAYCILAVGEGLHTERSSIALLSEGVEVRAALPGGPIKSLLRHRFGEESLIMAHCVAAVHGAWVGVSPLYPGDILVHDLTEEGLYVEAGSLLAMADTVDVEVRPASLRNVALHEGATILRASGQGTILFSAYGSIERVPLADGAQLIVDTGHLVAWTPSTAMRVGPLTGLTQTVLTGAGLVAEFTGPGEVFVQTRSPQGIRSWMYADQPQNSGQ